MSKKVAYGKESGRAGKDSVMQAIVGSVGAGYEGVRNTMNFHLCLRCSHNKNQKEEVVVE